MKRTLAVAVTIVVLGLAIASGAHGQQPRQIVGDVPSNGGYGLVVWGGGTTQELQVAAAQRGCGLVSAWFTERGTLVGYIYGVPEFVNAAFVARFPSLALPAGGLILVCSTPVPPGPTAQPTTIGTARPPSTTATPPPSPGAQPTVVSTSQPQPGFTPTPTGTPAASQPFYANCTEARAAGAAPLYRAQPGYREALDRDGDGVACETS